jgi:hypothetical protein
VAASVHAIFHFADPLTIRGALCADLGAQATGAFVKFRADQHDVRGCSTDLGASHDQAEVLGFGMLTAELQTMSSPSTGTFDSSADIPRCSFSFPR